MGLSCLLPGLAWGADLRLSISGAAEYDDNIFRSSSDKKNDVVFRIAPEVRVVEDREQLNYFAGYSLPYEVGVKYNNSDEVNDLNHILGAGFRYRATPQTEFFGDEGFYYVAGLFRQQQEILDPIQADLGDDRARILSNVLGLGVTHNFTPRLSGTLRVNNSVYDTTQDERSNVLSFGGSASSNYQLSEQHQAGGGFSFSWQGFDQTFNRPASNTYYYNLFGSWQWLFDETTTFSVQAGPALIQSNQDTPPMTITDQLSIPFTAIDADEIRVFDFASCPVVGGNSLFFDNAGNTCNQVLLTDPPDGAAIDTVVGAGTTEISYAPGTEPQGVSDLRVTYFANASLTKRWTPSLASSLSYVRQENAASGIDGGAVIDAVIVGTSWRISERWDLALRGDWTQRTSATEGARVFVTAVPQDIGLGPGNLVAASGNLVQIDSADSLDTQRWGTAARLAYRLTKNTVTSLQYAYNKQSSDGDTVGQSSDFDNHLVTFTVQYNFEPIGLW